MRLTDILKKLQPNGEVPEISKMTEPIPDSFRRRSESAPPPPPGHRLVINIPMGELMGEIPPELEDNNPAKILTGMLSSYILSNGMKKLLHSMRGIIQQLEENENLLTEEEFKVVQVAQRADAAAQRLTQEKQENPGNRYAHAMKRLKEKRLWVPSVHELRKKAQAMDQQGVPGIDLSMLLTFMTSKDIDNRYFSGPISDELWIQSIELAMYLLHPDVYKDTDAKFAQYLESDICVIYSFAYLLAFNQRVQEDNARYMSMEKDLQRVDEIDAQRRELEEQVAKGQEMEARLRRELSMAREDMAAKCRSYEKKITGLEHKLEDTIHEKDMEIDFFCRQNARLLGLDPEQTKIEDEKEAEELPFEDGDEADDMEEFEHHLPETGILFLGGHVNLVNKMRQRHPGWRFQSDNQFTCSPGTRTELVFMWSKHMSHSLQEKVFSVLSTSVPVIYLNATNLNMLEHEMKQKYNEYAENSGVR